MYEFLFIVSIIFIFLLYFLFLSYFFLGEFYLFWLLLSIFLFVLCGLVGWLDFVAK